MSNVANSPTQNIKKVLRQRMIARRRALTGAEAQRSAAAAQGALMEDMAWVHAQQVVLYVAARGEMGTAALLEAAWSAGKQVLLPRCHARHRGHMDFVRCAGMNDLVPGRFGLLEPHPDMPALPWESEDPHAPHAPHTLFPDLLILPGAAFDVQGNRLGQGGGYYDRALSHPAMNGATRVGLAYSWQVVKSLPVELWDCPVHGLCTEEGVQWL